MKKSLFQEFKEDPLKHQICIVLMLIALVHLAAFAFVLLCLVTQFLFQLSTEFWIFFYNFIANGFSFPEAK